MFKLNKKKYDLAEAKEKIFYNDIDDHIIKVAIGGDLTVKEIDINLEEMVDIENLNEIILMATNEALDKAKRSLKANRNKINFWEVI